MSEKWINEHTDISNDAGKRSVLQDCTNGFISSVDPRMRKIQMYSMIGLAALRNADNVRTMSEMPAQIGAQLLPIDKMMRGFTNMIFRKGESRVLSKALRNEASVAEGRVAANTAERSAGSITRNRELGVYENGFRKPNNTYGDTMVKGYEQGAALGEKLGLGVTGSMISGTAWGVTRTVGSKAFNSLPQTARGFLEGVGRNIADKWNGVYDRLFPLGSARNLLRKYGWRTLSKQLSSSMSEGSEEGVQFLNSLEDYSKYGYGEMPLYDAIANDISQGMRMAEIWGTYLGLADSELKNDYETWKELTNNVKGGFLLGGGHVGLLQFANNARDGYVQYSTD